jgi:3-dehydroquinate synthase
VNLAAGKNLAGAFHQPRGVFVATRFLATLPPREFAAGMAEVIKYGLLGDLSLFEQLEREPLVPGSPGLPSVVGRCCELKARIVEKDERELAPEGGRALLNLGHTFAHAIEQATRYGTYLHGEAVAIGICAAARLSESLDLLQAADVARVEGVLRAHALPVRLREPLPVAALMAAMGRDKKVRVGELRFVVLKALGAAATMDNVDRVFAEAAFLEAGATR